jgi:hypothetical protein
VALPVSCAATLLADRVAVHRPGARRRDRPATSTSPILVRLRSRCQPAVPCAAGAFPDALCAGAARLPLPTHSGQNS